MSGYSIEKKTITAKRLKELREEKKLSHIKLSDELEKVYGFKISRESLLNYEVMNKSIERFKAGYGMSIKNLSALADFYNVSTDYLLGNTDIKTSNQDIKGVCEFTCLSEESVKNLFDFIQRDSKHQDLNLAVLHILFEKKIFINIIDEISKSIINTAVYNIQQSGKYYKSPANDKYADDYFDFSKWKFSNKMLDLYEEIHTQIMSSDNKEKADLAAMFKIYANEDCTNRLPKHLKTYEYDSNDKG